MPNLALEVVEMLGQTINKVVPITIVLALVFSVLTHFWACNPGKPWWRKRELVTDICYWFFVPLFARVLRIGLLILGAGIVFNIHDADELIAASEAVAIALPPDVQAPLAMRATRVHAALSRTASVMTQTSVVFLSSKRVQSGGPAMAAIRSAVRGCSSPGTLGPPSTPPSSPMANAATGVDRWKSRYRLSSPVRHMNQGPVIWKDTHSRYRWARSGLAASTRLSAVPLGQFISS